MRACYSVRGGAGERVLIPGCWGSAIYGKRGCTCHPEIVKAESESALEKRLERIEAKLDVLLNAKFQ